MADPVSNIKPATKQTHEIVFEVNDTALIPRNGKNGQYFLQSVDFHEKNRDGSPKRNAREVFFFPQKINGAVVAYPKGFYTLAPHSLVVDEGGFLKLGFANLLSISAPF